MIYCAAFPHRRHGKIPRPDSPGVQPEQENIMSKMVIVLGAAVALSTLVSGSATKPAFAQEDCRRYTGAARDACDMRLARWMRLQNQKILREGNRGGCGNNCEKLIEQRNRGGRQFESNDD